MKKSSRDQILNKALDVFLEKGYHSTTLMDVVTAAQRSKGGFYYYFESKEDLLLLIHDIFVSHALEKAEEVRNMPGTAVDRLRQAVIDMVDTIERYRPHVTVFFEGRRFLSTEKFAPLKDKRDRYEAIIQELVADGIRNGEFRQDLHQHLVTLAILGMCNWTYQWLRSGTGLTATEIGEVFSRLILGGLRASPGMEVSR